MSDYYDRDGRPLTLHEWAAGFEDPEYKRVDEDDVGGVRVSTVWLGLDHGHGAGRPLIFETMVFGGVGDGDVWRYATEAEALAGHVRVVRRERRRAGEPAAPPTGPPTPN